MNEAKKYYAFISYKREDKRQAMWLQHKLEYYKVPLWARKKNIDLPKKIRPIFRDVTDLSGGVLEKAIQEGLHNSRYLIVICSPSSANSTWVGKEVQTFIDEGREEQIIPFIIDGIPNSGDPRTECYPESLRRLTGSRELLGINIHEAGRRAAFIKVVAMMFGLSFDELWGRYRRQMRIQRAWLTAACLLVLTGLALTFDYFRTKSTYFADYAVCEGMPVGILPLSADEASERPYYYRFESSRRQLRRIVHCNMWGHPAEHSNTAMTDRYAIQEIGYENGVFTSITQCDAQGTPIYKEVYNPPRYDRVDLKNNDTGDAANLRRSYTSINPFQQEKQPFNINTLTNNGKAKIGRYVLEYDAYGYVERKLFKRYNGDNSHVGKDSNGVCGLLYVRDGLHRVTELYYLDEEGEVMADRYGVAGRKYEYDSQGYICSEVFVDLKGNPVRNELSYARSTIDYRPGLDVTETYYGSDGKPCLNKFGYHRCHSILNKDSLQNFYFGLSGEPVLFWDVESGNGGYHMQTIYMDKYGYPQDLRFFGTDSLPVYIQPGYHRIVSETGDNGLPARLTCYDTDGRKVNTGTNVCEVRLRYEDGKEVEKTFYNNQGQRINSTANYSKTTSRYKDGRLTERRYYDRNDVPTASLEILGAHGLQLRYDDSGNVTEVRTLTPDGKLGLNSNGFARVKMAYDEAGNCIQSTCYDTEGNLTTAANGVTIVRNEYYLDGSVMRTSYYNRDDSLSCNIQGYAIEEFKYDKFGAMTERRLYDEHHQLKNGPQGWAIMRWKYQNNRPISAAAFDADDHPTIELTTGCHLMKYEYDSRGYLTATTCWNIDGQPMLSKTTHNWKHAQLRNLRGQVVEERTYDTNGRLICNASGAAIGKAEYTDQGYIKHMTYYDEYEQPVNISNGYASITNTWNERGLPLESAYFDKEGRPTNNNLGFHRLTNTYDKDGKLLMSTYYDKEGHLCMGPAMNKEIGAIQKAIYNKNGDIVFSVLYDTERNAIFSQYTQWDDTGKAQRYLARSNGLIIYEQDSRGNMKSYSTTYYGTDKEMKQLTDSLNQLFDNLEQEAKYMYE